jgi:hypothetical protein
VLTSGISEDVVAAMKKLVAYILRSPEGDGPLAKACNHRVATA